jgi:hypothetical protein
MIGKSKHGINAHMQVVAKKSMGCSIEAFSGLSGFTKTETFPPIG